MIGSKEAGVILGVSKHTVMSLVNRKLLTDYAKPNGKSKHRFKFKVGEVRALARSYRKGIHTKNQVIANGKTEPSVVRDTSKLVANAIPNGIFSRLERIESKLNDLAGGINNLLKIWE